MNDFKFKTYTEVLADAKAIHPDAQVRMNMDNKWEIFIATEFLEAFKVESSWAGTPAEEAFNTMSSGGDDELTRWGYKNGYSEYPLDLLAERYNIMYESQVWGQQRMTEELEKVGFGDIFNDRSQTKFDKNILNTYEALRLVIGAEMEEKFAERAAALDAKLGFASGVLKD